MIYIHHKPIMGLLPHIDRYWYCNSGTEKEVNLFPFFIGTGVDLFIHFGTPFYVANVRLASSHIACCRQTSVIESREQMNFIAVRFCYGSFRHFCPINFSELNNRYLSVQDIWGNEGQELIRKLHDEQSFEQRVNILNDFFMMQFRKYNKTTQRLDFPISHIYKNYEDAVITSLAKDQNMSLRHFERLFKHEFGITPKKFQIVSRFKSTLKQLLLTSGKDYLQIALENGYYDQSHFIKECKLLTDMSPSEILDMKDKRVHFYFHRYMESPHNNYF